MVIVDHWTIMYHRWMYVIMFLSSYQVLHLGEHRDARLSFPLGMIQIIVHKTLQKILYRSACHITIITINRVVHTANLSEHRRTQHREKNIYVWL